MQESVLDYRTAGGRFAYVCDDIVLFSTGIKDTIKRTVAVIKERASTHDLGIHALEITERGLRVR